MTPLRKEIIGNATLYLGDSRELLPSLRGDAVISDPPYGQREQVKRAAAGRGFSKSRPDRYRPSKDHPEIEGDDAPFDPSPWLSFGTVILWGANHYADRLPTGKTKWLVWDKRCGKGNDDNADCEMAWTNLKGVDRVHRQLWRGFCREGEDNAANGVLHPMQKPVELMAWCIEQAKLPPGATVLDGYMGSSPVGIACLRAGLTYIGIEKVPHYFDIACQRIEEAQRQGRLIP